jgi:hypothetical protein
MVWQPAIQFKFAIQLSLKRCYIYNSTVAAGPDTACGQGSRLPRDREVRPMTRPSEKETEQKTRARAPAGARDQGCKTARRPSLARHDSCCEAWTSDCVNSENPGSRNLGSDQECRKNGRNADESQELIYRKHVCRPPRRLIAHTIASWSGAPAAHGWSESGPISRRPISSAAPEWL